MDGIAPGGSPTTLPPAKGKLAPGSVGGTGTTSAGLTKKKSSTGLAQASSSVPLQSSSPLSTQAQNLMQLGVLLSLLVLAIYFYGVVQSLYALPEISLQLAPPLFTGHEANLNVAMDKYESVSGVQTSADGMPIVMAAAAAAGAAVDAHPHAASSTKGVKRTQLKDVQIPRHVWPPSIKNEPDRFETISHPADTRATMSVPLFWSQPLHEHGLMTKELALGIGSCSVPDPQTGSYSRGEECPEDDRTIYFAIASYRDFQCRFTVESAFGRAKNPKRIRVGTSVET